MLKPDGIHEADPCIYKEIERYENVTIIINRCTKCGHIDISWLRQENTRKVEDNEDYC